MVPIKSITGCLSPKSSLFQLDIVSNVFEGLVGLGLVRFGLVWLVVRFSTLKNGVASVNIWEERHHSIAAHTPVWPQFDESGLSKLAVLLLFRPA